MILKMFTLNQFFLLDYVCIKKRYITNKHDLTLYQMSQKITENNWLLSLCNSLKSADECPKLRNLFAIVLLTSV